MSDEKQEVPPPPPLTAPKPASEIVQPLVAALSKYVAAESAAVDGEWDHLCETHSLLLGTVDHLKGKSAKVVDGIHESGRSIDQFLVELSSRTEEVECTLSVLESVAAGLEDYSRVLAAAFPATEKK